MSSRRIVGTAALVLGMSVAAGAAWAQSGTYMGQLSTQIGTHASDFTNRGFSPVGSFQSGSLRQGENGNHTVDMVAGRTYGLLGVCDNDCSDVDLTLYDPSGNQVAQDILTDDFPEITITASQNGTYRLRVTMATCRVSPCFYAVQMYVSGGGNMVNAPTPMNQPTPMGGGAGAPSAIGMINVGQQVTGNLTYNDQRYNGKPIQAWGLNCTAGQTFQMDVLSSWDNYAVLFDPMGNEVAHDDDGGEGLNARISYSCSVTGTYRLGISVYAASTTPGNYTLQVQGGAMLNQPTTINQPQPMGSSAPLSSSNTSPAPAPTSTVIAAPGQVATIGTGQTMLGRLEIGDRVMTDSTWADIWQFQGQAGQSVTIELRSTEFDTYLQLLDGNNNRLAEDDDSLGDLNSRITYRLPTSGMYQIIVNNYGDTRRAGAYTLTVR